MGETNYENALFALISNRENLDKRVSAYLSLIKREKPDSYWYGEFRNRLFNTYCFYSVLAENNETLDTTFENVSEGFAEVYNKINLIEKKELGYSYEEISRAVETLAQASIAIFNFDKKRITKKIQKYSKNCLLVFKLCQNFDEIELKQHPFKPAIDTILSEISHCVEHPLHRAIAVNVKRNINRRSYDPTTRTIAKIINHPNLSKDLDERLGLSGKNKSVQS